MCPMINCTLAALIAAEYFLQCTPPFVHHMLQTNTNTNTKLDIGRFEADSGLQQTTFYNVLLSRLFVTFCKTGKII